jgi:ubiquinone/menaquinone biosynthesis C-methylase UbiE
MEPIKANYRFSDVDLNDEAKGLLAHQDRLNANASIIKQKKVTYDLMGLQPGDMVLDVGCGLGDDVYAMSAIIGESGQAYGVCNSDLMINTAKQRFSANNVSFENQDVYQLRFDDNTFDSVRADRVFIHLDSAEKALAEMLRVLKPGGSVVINEPDFRSFLFAPSFFDPRLNALYLDSICAAVPAPYMGLELQPLFRQHKRLNAIHVRTALLEFYDPKECLDVFVIEDTLNALVNAEALTKEHADDCYQAMMQCKDDGLLLATASQYAVVARLDDC